MDEVKKTYRDVETTSKEAIRDVDGHDLSDDLGNAGDEARRKLGNLGDDIRHEADQRGETDDGLHK